MLAPKTNCQGCTKRYPGCHDHCESYQTWKAWHDKKTAAERRDQEAHSDQYRRILETQKRSRKWKKVEDYRDPEVLRRLYWDERLTLEEMADKLYVSPATVRDHMKKHGVPTRPAYAYFRGKIDYWDKAVLEECIRQGMSNHDIAKASGMHHTTILHWMEKYGLKNTNSKPVARYDVGGRMLTVAEMAAESGLTKSNIQSRLQRGWKPDAAMAVPSLAGTHYVRGPQAAKLRREGKFEYGVYYQGSDRGNSGRDSGSNHGR